MATNIADAAGNHYFKHKNLFAVLVSNLQNRYQIQVFRIYRSGVVREIIASMWERGTPQNLVFSENDRVIYVSNAVTRTISRFIVRRKFISISSSVHTHFSPWNMAPYRHYLFASELLGSKVYIIRFRDKMAKVINETEFKGTAISGIRLLGSSNCLSSLVIFSAIGKHMIIVHENKKLSLTNKKRNECESVSKKIYWAVFDIRSHHVSLVAISLANMRPTRVMTIKVSHPMQAIVYANGKYVYIINKKGVLSAYHLTTNGEYLLFHRKLSNRNSICHSLSVSGKYLLNAQRDCSQVAIYRINHDGFIKLVFTKKLAADNHLIDIAR